MAKSRYFVPLGPLEIFYNQNEYNLLNLWNLCYMYGKLIGSEEDSKENTKFGKNVIFILFINFRNKISMAQWSEVKLSNILKDLTGSL